MTLATEIRKLRESRVYYAAAGAGDLAAEKLREVPAQLSKLQKKAEGKDLGGTAVAYVAHVGARAVEVFDELAERGRRVLAERGGGGQRLEATTEQLPKTDGTRTKAIETDKTATAQARKPRQSTRARAAAGSGKKAAD